jgi:hypothetical protein
MTRKDLLTAADVAVQYSQPALVVVTGALCSLIWWGANRIVCRLDSIESAFQAAQLSTQVALTEHEIKIVSLDEILKRHIAAN